MPTIQALYLTTEICYHYPMHENTAIAITNISKWYGTKKKGKYSVKHLTMEIKKGAVFGFLGPNGAGKTTTIKMLVGLANPTSGTITIHNNPPHDIRTKQLIGFMPEAPSFYLYLTGYEFLEFVAELFAVPHKEKSCMLF
jgi:ABC-2 type transport system ATP-binding protein